MDVATAMLCALTLCPAYIGPGLGLSAIAALVGLGFAAVAALFGFIWYPIRRTLKRFRATDHGDRTASS
jgi:hypothetical protein